MYKYRFILPKDKSLIEQIIELGDTNKKTLGFIPKSAFLERAHKGHIFACLEEEEVIGYILFWPRSRDSVYTINHVCVKGNYRKQGIAPHLVTEFVHTFYAYRHIRLSCRNDYLLNKFWQSLGFKLYNLTAGKDQKQYSILYQYTLHPSKDLLDIIEKNDDRINVLLDDSIVFSINMEDSYDNLNNSLLTLSSEVRYVIAPVLHDDFARQRDKIIKQRTIEQIKLFPTLPINKNKEERLYKEIKDRFINLKDNDIWQLCSAIADHINIFVTNDRQILSL